MLSEPSRMLTGDKNDLALEGFLIKNTLVGLHDVK